MKGLTVEECAALLCKNFENRFTKIGAIKKLRYYASNKNIEYSPAASICLFNTLMEKSWVMVETNINRYTYTYKMAFPKICKQCELRFICLTM